MSTSVQNPVESTHAGEPPVLVVIEPVAPGVDDTETPHLYLHTAARVGLCWWLIFTSCSAFILISHRDHATECGVLWLYCLLFLCLFWIPLVVYLQYYITRILCVVLNLGFLLWGSFFRGSHSKECSDFYSIWEKGLYSLYFVMTYCITFSVCCVVFLDCVRKHTERPEGMSTVLPSQSEGS